ncbi:rod-binding protein [Aureimonas glaciei]|uniref:Flagellar protein FlgJ N-terminal domain-containing protein n=1 Tax=Aureimonas glaciei TaxID=1776957 RepID=A0A917DDE5_9HYPH|nr:rod-binding protein [Aureimonas glaciei]GGD27655.1 hypothetical protein GCM10011335_33450 [Aureimonas glaciei]
MTSLTPLPTTRPASPAAASPATAGAAATSPAASATGDLFAANVVSAAKAAKADVPVASAGESYSRVYRGSRSGTLPPSQQFESFVLRTFVESMLPQEDTSYFGTGTAGKIWKSMLAERIGEEMAKGGGIGIAAMIDKGGSGAKAIDAGREELARADTVATGAAALKGLGPK